GGGGGCGRRAGRIHPAGLLAPPRGPPGGRGGGGTPLGGPKPTASGIWVPACAGTTSALRKPPRLLSEGLLERNPRLDPRERGARGVTVLRAHVPRHHA